MSDNKLKYVFDYYAVSQSKHARFISSIEMCVLFLSSLYVVLLRFQIYCFCVGGIY